MARIRLLGGLFWAVAAMAQVQPVTNGGFETLGPDGQAVDWEHVGETIDYSTAAHSGARALRLVRTPGQATETGLNRGWQPNRGQQGAMLSQLKGALVFWYRIVRLDPGVTMSFYAIPMGAEPFESKDATRARADAPASHAGDGQWHRLVLAYDFTAKSTVKWVQVSPRLLGSGGGEVLLDDLSWLPEAGPQPRLLRARIVPAPGDRSGPGELLATVQNAGDRPCTGGQLTLEAPAPWRAGALSGVVAGLGPDEVRLVKWPLAGRRTGHTAAAIRLSADGIESDLVVPAAPALALVAVVSDPPLPEAGRPVTFRAIVENRGEAAPRSPEVRYLTSGGFREQTIRSVALQRQPSLPLVLRDRYEASWTLTPMAGEAPTVMVSLRDEGVELGSQTIQLEPPLASPPKWIALGGAVEVGTDRAGRSAGRIVVGRRTVAALPHLGEVVLPGEPPEVVRPGQLSIDSAGGVSSQVPTRAGATWTFRMRCGVTADRLTPLQWSASCDRESRVLAIRAPEVLAVGQRREALFCGLEWLAPGELSSSDLDIAATHPQRLRFTTHPNNVTIPAMAAEVEGGTVGLLWSTYGGSASPRPQPIFASPDRFGHRDATRMGLMWPNVLEGLPENSLLAEPPMTVAAGEPVRFEATLYAGPPEDRVLDVMRAWPQRYQPVAIPALPHGTVEAELAFSARAYLDSLWDAESRSWWNFKLGPAVTRNLSRSPFYVYDLLQISRLAPDQPEARPAADRAAEMLELAAARPQTPNDAGYYAGEPLGLAQSRMMAGEQTFRSMEPDGGWSFQPPLLNSGVFKGKDYYELGEPGMKADGLMAQRLHDLLTTARLVGDRTTYDRAVPSLEHLRSFTIPRAAQVWEVPVHTPDILAAAEACQAFLEAYRMSGERRWLDAARDEAWAGMPFIYVWGEPGKPWMCYGSIPVFGATWFQGSWFGRLVQWNGLRYAEALLQLAEFDDGPQFGHLSWRDIARGIMVSAMYQQREDEGFVGLWPDALGTRDEQRAAWEFAPRQILTIQFELLNRHEFPRTVYLSADAAPVVTAPRSPHVTVTGLYVPEPTSRLADGRLTLTYGDRAAPAAERVTIAGLARPAAIAVAGQRGDEVTDLAHAAPGQWRYLESGKLLGLVLPATAGPVTVVVDGVTLAEPDWRPTVVDRIAFEFDHETGGWHAAHDLSELSIADGALTMQTTGSDPYLVRAGCDLAPDSVKIIRLRLRVSAGGDGQLFWATAARPAFSEDLSLRFRAEPGEWREVVLPVGNHPGWRGQRITSLRVDPTGGPAQADIAIDYLRGE